jgi:hypothetical protein
MDRAGVVRDRVVFVVAVNFLEQLVTGLDLAEHVESRMRRRVAYNDSSRLERRRFTIAHELGHFLLPLHGAGAQCVKADMGVLASKDANRAREAEANRFAASLLMPKALFERDIRRLGTPETEHIVKLAGDYEVSKEAAARRYTDLCDHCCAVTFSRHGNFGTFANQKRFRSLIYVATSHCRINLFLHEQTPNPDSCPNGRKRRQQYGSAKQAVLGESSLRTISRSG